MADDIITDDSKRNPARTTSPGQDSKERFERRKSWFVMAMRQHEANRYQMALDEDYYDSIHYTPDETADIIARGQNPVVYNEVFPTINWLIGTERRMRRDFKVLARHDKTEGAEKDAQIKTKLLKYLDDVNREAFERSQACDDAWKGGVGWIEIGIRDDPEAEPIYTRAESWRNIVYDPLSTKPDLSDARYLFRFREVDLDIAISYFPEKEEELRKAAAAEDSTSQFTGGWYSGWPISGVLGSATMPARWLQYDSNAWLLNPRKRVLLIECWSYEPTDKKRGESPSSFARGGLRMRVSIMTEFDTLIEADSPYKHNKFPFVPVWAYRRKKDRMPYSPIRPVRGPQDDLNKRMSKSLFLLSINQLRLEKGAIDPEAMDEEQLREETAAPDGVAIFADGALSGGKVQVRDQVDLAQGHLAIADRDMAAVRSTAGVPAEQRGLDTNATSRVAIDAKAQRGSVVTAELFDNLMFAHQLEGEIKLSLIEQYYDERKVFSVTGERYKLDYITINEVDPATGQKINDVTAFKAQFVIGEVPWRQHLNDAMFESAMNMLGNLSHIAPQVVTSILDLVFEWADLPNKQTFLQRIRMVTGMSDPEKGDTPEQAQKRQMQQMMAMQQFQTQMALMRAKVQEAEAKGQKLEANAMRDQLQAVKDAAEAAMAFVQFPGAAPIADELLKSAGFKDKGEPPQGQLPPPEPQPQPQPSGPMPQPAPAGATM